MPISALVAHALPPLDDDDPCGPDLDFEGDRPFMNYLAANEGLLRIRYYDFKRDDVDFRAALAKGEELLARSLDVRLTVMLAKLSILNRDIAGFARWVGSTAWLLDEHWDGVHPRAEGEDFGARLAQLMSMEDNNPVLLPLQYAPLLESGRIGAVPYRAHLVASGLEKPRVVSQLNSRGERETSEAENFVPARVIEQLLRDIEMSELSEVHELLVGLAASIAAIGAVTAERLGAQQACRLEKLAKLVDGMVNFLAAALAKRDPSRAPPAASNGSPTAAGAPTPASTEPRPATNYRTLADIDGALGASLGYFLAAEPSSPAVLLIRQARETLGKNLYEVMKLLTPAHADNARVFVGPDSAFTVPVKALATATTKEVARVQAPAAANRTEALALIESVANHMRMIEPSSPTPYLLDRAKMLATRDFLSLLMDVLPEDAIASLKKGK